jgi:enoyl-CoA hydratase
MALVVTEKIRPNVTVIRLNRPERLNAMSFELITALCDACAEVGADNRCWVVILTGEGRGFCSGLDLEDPGVIPGIDEMALSRVGMLAMSHFSKVVPALRAMPQPVIAAINGCAYSSTPLGSSTASRAPSSAPATCCPGRSACPAPTTCCSRVAR